MNKVLSFVKLDYITIKPYCMPKNLLLFAGLILVFNLTDTSGLSGIGVMCGVAALYVSYPFIVGEKCGIDVLYATLSIKRNTVVLGRYLFALSFDLLGALLSVAISFGLSLALGRSFEYQTALSTVFAMLLVFTVLQSVQLPLYFKFGYTKAKLLVYMPLIILPFGIYLLMEIIVPRVSMTQAAGYIAWLAANPVYTVIFGAAAWLMIMFFSYGAALSFYNKRDL